DWREPPDLDLGRNAGRFRIAGRSAQIEHIGIGELRRPRERGLRREILPAVGEGVLRHVEDAEDGGHGRKLAPLREKRLAQRDRGSRGATMQRRRRGRGCVNRFNTVDTEEDTVVTVVLLTGCSGAAPPMLDSHGATESTEIWS